MKYPFRSSIKTITSAQTFWIQILYLATGLLVESKLMIASYLLFLFMLLAFNERSAVASITAAVITYGLSGGFH